MVIIPNLLCTTTYITGRNLFEIWILPDGWICYIYNVNYHQEYHESY
jgi:hypothetical protein